MAQMGCTKCRKVTSCEMIWVHKTTIVEITVKCSECKAEVVTTIKKK